MPELKYEYQISDFDKNNNSLQESNVCVVEEKDIALYVLMRELCVTSRDEGCTCFQIQVSRKNDVIVGIAITKQWEFKNNIRTETHKFEGDNLMNYGLQGSLRAF